MASKRIDINITGKDNTAGAVKGAASNIKTLSTEANKAGSTIGSTIGSGATRAAGAIRSLGSSASSTFGMIKAGAQAASASLGDMGNLLGTIMGGFTAMEAGQMMWTGATQRQFNEMYLGSKMTTESTKKYLDVISKVVAAVPGDDTWMNALLTGALAKQTDLSVDMLGRLGVAASKYVTAAQQTGASILPVNAERELTSYIKSGNTGLMIRDGLLKMHIDDLQAAKTPAERILALEKAMTEEGYLQLDTAALVSSKWEPIKGTLQLAATNVGIKLLPFVEKLLDFIMAVDEKTNGWSTTIGFVGVALAAVAMAFAPIVTAGVAAYNAMRLYRIEAQRAAAANKSNMGPKAGAAAGGMSKSAIAADVGVLAAALILMNALNRGMEGFNYASEQAGSTLEKVTTAMGGFTTSLPLPWLIGQLAGVDTSIANIHKHTLQQTAAMGAAWNWLAASATNAWNIISGAARGAINGIMGAWNWLKNTVSRGVYGAINIGTSAISNAWNQIVGLYNYVRNGVTGVIKMVTGGGPAGPAGARGPGIGLHYENYEGSRKSSAWNAAGTGMSGNCVDMTLGLMSTYGGGMVSGTWNGGPHVWWQAPNGAQLDPARKALEGTWAPPARGPGEGMYGNIVINGDIYGFDDFKRKVEKANSSIMSDAGRY